MDTEQRNTMQQTTTLSAKQVQKALKNFERSFKAIKSLVIARYGETFGERVMAQTRSEYEKLLLHTPCFSGMINLFNKVVMFNTQMLSFYKAMKAHDKSAEDVVAIYVTFADNMHKRIPKPLRWLAQKFIFSPWFFLITRSSAKHVAEHEEGWQLEYTRGDGKHADWFFECKECGVIKFYRKHGAEELMPYCNFIDYIQGKTFGMGMQNPKNIGLGDSICVQNMKQHRETALPENLKSFF